MHDAAITAFQGTDVSIMIEGRRQLGPALGKRSFVEEYAQQKVAVWVQEIECLSSSVLLSPNHKQPSCIPPWSHE